MSARSYLAILCVVAVGGSLTACDPVTTPDVDASLSVIDGRVRVVSCDALQLTDIYAETRDFEKAGSEWIIFLEAHGQAGLDAGAAFGPGDLPEGLRATVEIDPELEAGLTVSVSVDTAAGSPRFWPHFVIPDGGLESGLWLRPNGDLWEEPCQPPS